MCESYNFLKKRTQLFFLSAIPFYVFFFHKKNSLFIIKRFGIRKVKLNYLSNFFNLWCDYKSLNLNHSSFSFLQIVGNASLINWSWAVKKYQTVTTCDSDSCICMGEVERMVRKVNHWVSYENENFFHCCCHCQW